VLAAAALSGGCDDSSPGGAGGGAAWWNQSPAFAASPLTPPSGSSGVDLCAPVRVAFSRDVDPATVTTSTFSLAAGGPVAGGVAVDPSNRSATFTPSGLLSASTLHTVTLTAGILSASGEALTPLSFTFTTAPPFARASSNPLPGAVGIPINTGVAITFNKAVNAATLQASDFAVTGTTFAAASYSAATRTVTLTTSGNLPPNSTITVTRSFFGSVLDACGEPLLPANVAFSFDTGASGDTTPPAFAGAASATAPNAITVVVSWSAATDNVTPQGSIVYRIYKGPGFGLYATTAAGATSFTDTGQSPGTTYSYIVRAVDGALNEDGNSVIRSTTTPARRTWTSVYTNIISGGGHGCTSCHGLSGGLTMTPDQATAYNELLNEAGACGTRVSPFNSGGSSLFVKTTTTPGCGSRMPTPASGFPVLSSAEQDELQDWIDEGALDN
jgi:hypothetical protein